MLRTLMKSKVHRATVTAANLHYVGSLTLDRDLMVGADLVPHERVQVLDIDNGTRLETYLIEGVPGSGELCINGAAARLVQPGDRVILVSYGMYTDAEARAHVPLVVVCDERNRAAATVRAETPATTASELIGSAR